MEAKIIADLRDVEKLSRKYPDISLEVRKAKIEEALNLLEREIKQKTPYGVGPIHLRDTIFHKVDVSGHKVEGITGTPLEHGLPVEMGTAPHFPPLAPIQFWVEKKLGYSGKEAKSVAYAIALKISKKGTKGAHMFEQGFENNEHKIRAILQEIGLEIARRVEML